MIPCPGVKCRCCLDDAWSDVIFPRKEGAVIARKLRNNKIRCVVDRQSSFLWCPIAGCGCIVMASSQLHDTSAASQEKAAATTPAQRPTGGVNRKIAFPQSVVCGKGHAFCVSCKGPSHSPSSCDDWRRWIARIQAVVSSVEGSDKDGNEIANALWVAANTKRCPKCELPIEKNEGCNHMSCRTCRHEFCWVCMKAWSLHSQDTGGYFQCNKFVSSSEGGGEDGTTAAAKSDGEVRFGFDAEDEAEDTAMEGFFGDAGSAYREEMRVRLKGQRMERFVHHYTHFRSHDDSVKMESSMFYDAMCRLSKTLLLSMGGICRDSAKPDYVWLQSNVINPMSAKTPYLQNVGSINEAEVYRGEIETLTYHLAVQEQLREQEKALTASSGEASAWSWRKMIFGDFNAPSTPSRPSLGGSDAPARLDATPASPLSEASSAAAADSSSAPVPVALSYSYKGDIEDVSNAANEFFIPVGGSMSTAEEPSRAWLSEKMRGLDFLQAGFRELLKCRQVSARYSFFLVTYVLSHQ